MIFLSTQGTLSAAIAQDSATLAGQTLKIAQVASPQINCVFDKDCRITVDDVVEKFTLPGTDGTGFLQSRSFPIGEDGTLGAGLHAYLYRIDLTQMRGETDTACIDKVEFNFAEIVPLSYNGTANGTADIFVVSRNQRGLGTPVRAVRKGATIEFTFRDLCAAGPNDNTGKDGYFFGMAAKSPARMTSAMLVDRSGKTAQPLIRSTSAARIDNAQRTTTPTGVPITSPDPRTYQTDTPTRTPTVQTSPDTEKPDAIINFEDQAGAKDGTLLINQYRENYGVRFGAGVSIHQCGGLTTREVACPYLRAADGRMTGFFDGQANGQVMIMEFARPVKRIAIRINPTGSKNGESFSFEMNGFRDGSTLVGSSRENFDWSEERATGWPVRGVLQITDAQGATRIGALLRASDQNNRSIRFLFDALEITYGEGDGTDDQEISYSPVGAGVFSPQQAREDANLGPPIDVGWPERLAQKKSKYKPAPRLRARINWAAAEAAYAEQQSRGLSPAAIRNSDEVNKVALPVLLPRLADTPIDLAATRDGNSYSATFERDGRQYDYYGSRMLTQLGNKPIAGSEVTPVDYIEGETGLSASFTLYGAVYRLMRTCKQESPRLDPDCFDTVSMEQEIRGLMIILGTRAGERP